MSKKTHYRVYGPDHRNQGQSQKCYDNQAACGFAGVTCTRDKADVTCKLCLRELNKK